MSIRPHRFTPLERRAAFTLAGVYGLRMLGLFLMMPVLALGVRGMPGADDARLVGLAIGVFGLTQALLQIPFGIASDLLGRRRVIVVGLWIFAAGSVWGALATSVPELVAARSLQGAGAISAAVSAYLADLTRDGVRTRAMALVGAAIGLSFALSLVLAPVLYGAQGLPGLFWLTGLLAVAASGLVMRLPRRPVDAPAPAPWAWASALTLLRQGQLLRLNVGIFVLMAIQAALFVSIPSVLEGLGFALTEHWRIYLPLLVVAFVVMLPMVFVGERRGQLRVLFLLGVGLLWASMVGMGFLAGKAGLLPWGIALLVFMVGFNLLEALLPSWVSRLAPAERRGLALGIYTTAQSLGLFVGGAAAGSLLYWVGLAGVFWACAGLVLAWGWVAWGMVNPPPRAASHLADAHHPEKPVTLA